MVYTLSKNAQAIRDIEEAFVYIAEDDLDAALRFLARVENCIESLTGNPFKGSNRSFINTRLKDVRLFPVIGSENYLIIYIVDGYHVKILRFINSKRDFKLVLDL
jgi:plasmid stabilization system protein ParE